MALTAALLGTPLWFHARTLYTEPFLVPRILGRSSRRCTRAGSGWRGWVSRRR